MSRSVGAVDMLKDSSIVCGERQGADVSFSQVNPSATLAEMSVFLKLEL